MRISSKLAAFAVASTALTPMAAVSADLHVVTSIKPIHSLVAGVMQGAGAPSLIVDGAASPHDYRMKPSQAHALEHADVVFWVGEGIETFLEKPLDSLGKNAEVIELMEADDITKLPFREGGAFEDHAHDDHHGEHDEHKHDEHKHDDHAKHDEHKHDEHKHDEHKHDEHKHDEHKHDDHAKHDEHKHDDHAKHDEHKHDEHKHDEHKEHDGHEGHAHGALDGHIWLDPENARAIVQIAAATLSEKDPANAATYKANASKIDARLSGLVTETRSTLAPVKDRPFVVFHDAYQYFDKRFGLNIVGSVAVNPEVAPGAKRVSEIHEKIEHLSVVCVFSEPQFKPKLVNVVIEGTKAKTGVIDPLGAEIANGPELYFDLIKNMRTSMKNCLEPSS